MAKEKAPIKKRKQPAKDKPEGEKHPGGRPSKYKPEMLLAVEFMSKSGLTDLEMAKRLGVSEVTFNAWKKVYPEFLKALKSGKEDADDRVERSLYERATGYNFDSEKIVNVSQGQGLGSIVQRVPIVEHCPPDVTACIFWLKNRRKETWRDKQDVEHSGSITIAATPTDENL